MVELVDTPDCDSGFSGFESRRLPQIMSHGVMVTREILNLGFQVRVLMAQSQEK